MPSWNKIRGRNQPTRPRRPGIKGERGCRTSSSVLMPPQPPVPPSRTSPFEKVKADLERDFRLGMIERVLLNIPETW